ncbi:MAG: hypothetical protein GX573_27620 [Chloroflexi bacterium]|nr:hypothetical protein [Chloroflexota bacterium]
MDYVKTLVGTAPPVAPPPGAIEQVFVSYGDQLIPLAFVCVISTAPVYCDLAKQYLLTLLAWPQWGENGARGLGHSHLLLGSALAFDWLYPLLNPAQRQAAGRGLATWAGRMYEASVSGYNAEWGNFWVKSYLQNFYWLTHASLGIAGLALLDERLPEDCVISPSQNVNRREHPGTQYAIVGTLGAGETTVVVDAAQGADGYLWWHLADESWVRSDVVNESPGCSTLDIKLGAEIWVEHAAQKLAIARDVLNAIGDSSWHESMHYENYLLVMSLPFILNLRDLRGIDLLPHAYLQNYPYWRIYNAIPDTTQHILAYGDFEWAWSNARRPQNVLRFIAAEYGDGHAAWMAQELNRVDGRLPEIWSAPWYVLEFLYYDPAVPSQPPDDLPPSRVFPDLEGVIWRTGWGADALIFGLKTSAPGGRFAFDSFIQGRYPWEPPCLISGCSLLTGHDHEDSNGFYLYGNGRWLAPEVVGVDVHNTSFHNTLLIDGEGQYRPPDNHYGRYPSDFEGRDGFLEATASGRTFHYVAADATRRYVAADLEDFTRYVVWVRNRYLVMLDNLAAGAPHSYEWVIHLRTGASLDGDWIRGDAGDGRILGVNIASPRPYVVTTGNDGLPYARVQPASPLADAHLIHVLMPMDSAGWGVRPDVSVIDTGGPAALVSVMHRDGSNLRDDVVITTGTPGAVVSVGPYATDGRVAVISLAPNGDPAALFVYGGTYLSDGPRTLVSGLVGNEPFEVHYDQALVTVTGQSNSEILLFAPQATHLIVNEIDWAFSREGDHIRFSPCPTLKLDVVPSEGGQVQALPEPDFTETRYRSGVDVSLTASAADGFRFAYWSGDASGSVNPP